MIARTLARSLTAVLVLTCWVALPAQAAVSRDGVSRDGVWIDRPESEFATQGERRIAPAMYRTVALDAGALAAALAAAPLEATALELGLAAGRIELPSPAGGFERFAVVESPIMAPELAAKYPEIRTYRVWGLDDPHATGRLDVTPQGFHAMVRSPQGAWFVDPFASGDTEHYQSYFTRDARNPAAASWQCGVEGTQEAAGVDFKASAQPAGLELSNGTMLRTYRTVVAATGEYTAFHGGTVPAGQAAIVTAMNRINEVYENDLAIRMELVGTNDQVVYTNGGTDPYTNNNGVAMLGQNQTNVDSVIGTANYDIGHVFSTGGGGVASLGVPCRAASKARGVTGLSNPTGDPFYIDFVAHEMGHQWGAPHSFNGSTGNCSGGNRNGPTAYEPGSGSTIMAYAGICGSQNLQSNSDPYFHITSLDSIVNYSVNGFGDTCAVTTPNANTPPAVDAGPTYTIPIETPFSLCGSGSDSNGDALTYAWEEFDLGPAGAPNTPVNNAPIFRSFNPVDRPFRTFPKESDLLGNTSTIGEILPTYSRTLNFRLTARDNRLGGGGITDDATQVVVSDVGGPFLVTTPNTAAVSWTAGGVEAVQWDPAGTSAAPIDCQTVSILLSIDGGSTFPFSLTETPNDGSAAVTVPTLVSGQARVQVRCAGGAFFDISDEEFAIVGADLLISARNFEDCRGFESWDGVVN